MTRAEALAAVGLPADAPSLWPACGCSDDEDDPDCGGTGEAETCQGPQHRALFTLAPHADEVPCRCPCHGGAS